MWARLDDKNQIVEIRELTELFDHRKVVDEEIEGEVVRSVRTVKAPTGFDRHDAPHKGIRWREIDETQPPQINERTHSLSSELVYDPKSERVQRVWTISPQPIDDLRVRAVGEIYRMYRDRIVDALPDMERISDIVKERDTLIDRANSSDDPGLVVKEASRAKT